MLTFRPIDLNKDRQQIIKFRMDSFKISFGHVEDFNEENYLTYVEERMEQFPEGYVMVEKDDRTVGQLELSVRLYGDKRIGYVHLFYLVPEERGTGISRELVTYAHNFFKMHHIQEYHLRVASLNNRARKFYEKNNMVEVGPELDGKVIRMKGFIT
ncbi:Acetyltransferase (GNAT) domain-containing protein [Halobacillus karajensis]|uniref:GNAT family N-acetyltransferase n=1 Tax=Halobacillus karajensis TaxID=195088 RepID=UPI00045C8961|nr:GNAT family N-acetyltransferase [Halobacillus karajensis]CDQ17841.1 pseudaminic acid biosynthesis N-acetyl transferase [Halobacillus karajensis]CDQ29504.1 pseudaminic acid biosynthesis N-acetyl transferase [Halobacillus karajensis]SEH62919.1 Acetyltransferase (GNAT) domain-containing protein [Halobacillus karajensis]